jgi:hypothetical protein
MRAIPNGGVTNPLMAIRPSFSAQTSGASNLQSGNFNFAASLPGPFRDGFGVASVLSAYLPGPAPGDLPAYVHTTIQPLVHAWADDGTLYTNYVWLPDMGASREGTTPAHDPNVTIDESAIIKNVGWPLAYVSNARHEALYFFANGQVLLVRWAPLRYTEQTVPVSKQQAIANTVAALRDPKSTSEEARTGLDYFLGIPFAGVFAPSSVNYRDDLVPTFDVPDGINWSAFLANDFFDKPTWYVGSTVGGSGLVDAVTGKLIRFTRLRAGHGTGGAPSPFTAQQP